MGFSPAQVDAMSLWEFQACRNGFEAANTPDDDGALTQSDYDAIAAHIPVGLD
jgi:hypothetical protein